MRSRQVIGHRGFGAPGGWGSKGPEVCELCDGVTEPLEGLQMRSQEIQERISSPELCMHGLLFLSWGDFGNQQEHIKKE